MFTLKGSLDFFVSVHDTNPINQEESLVAHFLVPVSLTPNRNSSRPVMAYSDTRNLGQFFRLGFQLSCTENFYGENCTRYCVGRDDEDGHFTCDINGTPACLEGFQDEATNCVQCVLSEGCCKSLYTYVHALSWVMCM